MILDEDVVVDFVEVNVLDVVEKIAGVEVEMTVLDDWMDEDVIVLELDVPEAVVVVAVVVVEF